jgi:hypothetical protein
MGRSKRQLLLPLFEPAPLVEEEPTAAPARLTVVPVTLRAANAFVAEHHRHAVPVTGCRFAVGASVGAKLVGVAIAGRPVARHLDDGRTLEVLRVCTDGTANACSFLYGRCRLIGRSLGYQSIITYTLAGEPGASLRACGARVVARVPAQQWNRPSRPRAARTLVDRLRWEL